MPAQAAQAAAGVHCMTQAPSRSGATRRDGVGADWRAIFRGRLEAHGRALGMVTHGAGTAFPGADASHWLAISGQIRDAIKAGEKPDSAWETVAAANGISESKARDAWIRFQAACPELL